MTNIPKTAHQHRHNVQLPKNVPTYNTHSTPGATQPHGAGNSSGADNTSSSTTTNETDTGSKTEVQHKTFPKPPVPTNPPGGDDPRYFQPDEDAHASGDGKAYVPRNNLKLEKYDEGAIVEDVKKKESKRGMLKKMFVHPSVTDDRR